MGRWNGSGVPENPTMPEQCAVCGETKLRGWDVCPACGHPYPEPPPAPPDEDEEDEEDDDLNDEEW